MLERIVLTKLKTVGREEALLIVALILKMFSESVATRAEKYYLSEIIK